MNKNGMIRTLIVDDEPLARKKIRRFLESETDITIIGECKNGHEAVEAIKNLHPNLVVLDIQMPELDGIAVLQHLPLEEMPLVVFVTAYDQYAIKAFELHALDYLLKPFNRSRFQTALSRARKTLQKENPSAGFHSLLAFLKELKRKNDYLKRLMVKDREKVVVLDVEEIKWMESDRNYIDLHTETVDRPFRIRETLQNLETRLDPEKFVRVNRSTIINIAFIKEMQPMFKKEYVVIFKSGERFILNKKYFSHLESLFKQ
jgi:two-component system LytT family response regulator